MSFEQECELLQLFFILRIDCDGQWKKQEVCYEAIEVLIQAGDGVFVYGGGQGGDGVLIVLEWARFIQFWLYLKQWLIRFVYDFVEEK